jgi:hypothetical protein
VHELRIGAPGYKQQSVRFQDAPPPATIVLEKVSQAAAVPAAAKKPVAPVAPSLPASAPVAKRARPLSGTNGALILR